VKTNTDITAIQDQLKGVQEELSDIKALLVQKSVADKSLGDWIPEHLAIELSGLKKSSLFEMRKAGRLKYSTISGKGVFYRKSEFEKILNTNEKK